MVYDGKYLQVYSYGSASSNGWYTLLPYVAVRWDRRMRMGTIAMAWGKGSVDVDVWFGRRG
jgi:hypothetical protein